jgi:hypothetical protein
MISKSLAIIQQPFAEKSPEKRFQSMPISPEKQEKLSEIKKKYDSIFTFSKGTTSIKDIEN